MNNYNNFRASGLIPTIFEDEGGKFFSADLFSKLNKERIIFLNGEVDERMANIIIAQLLYLESIDTEKDIQLYINSPGGSVVDGMAIYDTMQYIKCDVSTTCMGLAASMGSVILAGGAKGKRFALPNSEIMIHQPLGGARGQATEIQIAAEHILKTKEKLTRIMAENCGQDYEKVLADMERDNWKTAEEAKAYGLIDEVVYKRS